MDWICYQLIVTVIIKDMAKKKKNPDIDGYPERHLAAMIRRKMIQKNHGDETKYDRKDKSWKRELKNKDEE